MRHEPLLPVHLKAMGSSLIPSIPYRLLERFYDSWWIGRRDADPGLAHEPFGQEQPSVSLRLLDAAFHERCERERMRTVHTAATLIERRNGYRRAEVTLRLQIDEWTAQMDEQGVLDPSELAQVARTEAHLEPAQRVGRRRREAAARVAPLAASRSAARGEVAHIERELADIEGSLTTLFESLQARVRALAYYYDRRCNTVIRGYLRRSPGDREHPLNGRSPLRIPDWAVSSNPWLAPLTDEAVGR